MRITVKEIAEKLEECMEGWEQFFNKETGEFVALSNGMYVESDEELAEVIENSCSYVRLPNQYDIHEWRIMEEFALTMASETKQNRLLRALHGKKAYRRFKDEIINMGEDQAYYDYRFQAFCRIAQEWLEVNQIPYAGK